MTEIVTSMSPAPALVSHWIDVHPVAGAVGSAVLALAAMASATLARLRVCEIDSMAISSMSADWEGHIRVQPNNVGVHDGLPF
jgi:hypothetical protein